MQKVLQDIPLIGKNMRKIRLSKGLTQSEVASRMQKRGSRLSRAAYSNIECGRSNIKASDLIILSKVCKVGIEAFFRS